MRSQYFILCIIIVIILYSILNEHVALMWNSNASTFSAEYSAPPLIHDNEHSTIHHHQLYFANEIALHTELIGYSYSDEIQVRKQNFNQEIQSFSTIGMHLICIYLLFIHCLIQSDHFELQGRDLLDGDIDSFKHLSRYYVHPNKYHQFRYYQMMIVIMIIIIIVVII